MKIISFYENVNLDKNHFKNLEEFQHYILTKEFVNYNTHKEIIGERMVEANENSENYITLKELKKSIKRK